MTYRVGNHHGVTIVDENPNHRCGRPDHDCARGHLIATAQTEDYADRIVEALNRVTPDVTHTRGAAEALAHVRRQVETWVNLTDSHYEAQPEHIAEVIEGMLQLAAAELGVDEDAPSGPSSLPESDLPGSVVGTPRAGAAETVSGRWMVSRDGKAGCPETVWDGPYSYRCSMGPGGVCATHGTWAWREPERKADQA